MYTASFQHDGLEGIRVESSIMSDGNVFCCSIFGSLNLTTVKLTGVGNSFQKHADAESKGIKAHFNMDESGVLLLDRVSSRDHFDQ